MKKGIVIFTILICFTFCGCIERTSNSVLAENKDNEIVYNAGKMENNLKVCSKENIRTQDLMLCLFEGIMKSDEKGVAIPGLCESYEIKDKGLTYVFKLRKNACFSDGTDIKASFIVKFFKDFLKSDAEAYYKQELSCITGVSEALKGKGSYEDIGITEASIDKIQFKLKYKEENFLSILTEPNLTIRRLDDNLLDFKDKYKNILYTGPFIIDSIKKDGISIKKNNSYYNSLGVTDNKIFIKLDNVEERALINYDLGKVNIFTAFKGVPSSVFETKAVPINELQIIIFNKNNKHNKNDLENLYNYLWGGIGNKDIKDFSLKSYNSKILDKENAAFIKEIENMKLLYKDNSRDRTAAMNISKYIKNNLKVDIKKCEVNESKFSEMIKNEDFDLAVLSINNNPFNEKGFYYSFTSNEGLVKDNTYDTFYELGDYDKCKDFLINNFIVIPLQFINTQVYYNLDMGDIYFTPEGNIMLDKLKRKTP